MTDQQRVTDEQLASWERLGRDEPTWTASALVQAVADLRASRAREAAWQLRWDFQHGVAQGWLANWKAAQQRIDKALALTYASDDGTEYSHSHRRGEGEPDCPACWAHDIRAALTGAAESHGERPPGPGTPAGPVQDAVRIAGAILAWCADERADPVILGSLSSDLTRLCESWGQGAPDA